MRVTLKSTEFTEITISSGTIQNVSPQAPVEISSTQTEKSGILLLPYESLQYGDNATVYARGAWGADDVYEVAVEPFKRAGEGGGYTLPIATSSELGGVKIGSNLSIDESGVLSAPVNYSTTEQKIGTWINGKPLYQITIEGTMPVVTTDGTRATKIVDISSLNIAFGVNIWGVCEITISSLHASSILNSASNPTSAFNYCCFSAQSKSNDSIFIATSRLADSNTPFYITIQYTKTTD